MTVAVVQYKELTPTVSTPSFTMSTAPTSGNWLIATMYYNGSPTPSAASGWTKISGDNSNGFITMAVYYKLAGGSESTTQTPNASGNGADGGTMWEISGLTGTWVTDFQQKVAKGYTSATYQGDQITLTSDALVLFIACMRGGGSGVIPSAITGFTTVTTGIAAGSRASRSAYGFAHSGDVIAPSVTFDALTSATGDVILALNGSSNTTYTLAATTGSFTLSGEQAGYTRLSHLVANAGAFVVSGVQAGNKRVIRIIAGTGSVALRGIPATLLYTTLFGVVYRLAARTGVFSVLRAWHSPRPDFDVKRRFRPWWLKVMNG